MESRAFYGLGATIVMALCIGIYVKPPQNYETMDKLSRGLPVWAEDGFAIDDGESMILLSKGWVVMSSPGAIMDEGKHVGVKYEWISEIEKRGDSYVIHNDQYDNYDLLFTPKSGWEKEAERVLSKVQTELDTMEEVED